MDFSNISKIYFGIEGTQTVRDAGCNTGSYKDCYFTENYDNGWKRKSGIHTSMNCNAVRFEGPDHIRATHYKLIKTPKPLVEARIPDEDNPDLIPWGILTDEVRSHLMKLKESREWVKPSDWQSAEKWMHRQKCFSSCADEDIVGYQSV